MVNFLYTTSLGTKLFKLNIYIFIHIMLMYLYMRYNQTTQNIFINNK